VPEFEQITGYQSVVGYGTDGDADGVIQYQVAQVPPSVSWIVERITIVTSDGFGNRPFRLYASPNPSAGVAPPAWTEREFTQSGGEAVADESSPIRFNPSEVITARWTGLTAATATWASVYLQIREVVPLASPIEDDEGAKPEEVSLKDLAPLKDWN
jgi:hypothetical protein